MFKKWLDMNKNESRILYSIAINCIAYLCCLFASAHKRGMQMQPPAIQLQSNIQLQLLRFQYSSWSVDPFPTMVLGWLFVVYDSIIILIQYVCSVLVFGIRNFTYDQTNFLNIYRCSIMPVVSKDKLIDKQIKSI